MASYIEVHLKLAVPGSINHSQGPKPTKIIKLKPDEVAKHRILKTVLQKNNKSLNPESKSPIPLTTLQHSLCQEAGLNECLAWSFWSTIP